MLCCPDCVMQHLEAALDPLDFQEQELRAYERRTQWFMGEDKPWSWIAARIETGKRTHHVNITRTGLCFELVRRPLVARSTHPKPE